MLPGGATGMLAHAEMIIAIAAATVTILGLT
jgi:hypothetical protein